MTLEQIPIVLGVLVALIGIGLIVDAVLPEQTRVFRERRRRMRAERHRGGEALVGLGTICMAAALIGRDGWDFGTVAVIAGAALLAFGTWQNREYLRELIAFRGPARRSERGVPATGTAGSADIAPRSASRAGASGATTPVGARAAPAEPAVGAPPGPLADRPPASPDDATIGLGARGRQPAARRHPQTPPSGGVSRPDDGSPPRPSASRGGASGADGARRGLGDGPAGGDPPPAPRRGASRAGLGDPRAADLERPIPTARERGRLNGPAGDAPDDPDADGRLRLR